MARTEDEEAASGFANHAQSKFRSGMLADRDFWRGSVRDDHDPAAFLSNAAGIYSAGGGVGSGAAWDRRYFRDADRRIPALEIRWTEADSDWLRRSGGGEFMARAYDARRGPVVDVLGCGGERILYRVCLRAAGDAGDGRTA